MRWNSRKKQEKGPKTRGEMGDFGADRDSLQSPQAFVERLTLSILLVLPADPMGHCKVCLWDFRGSPFQVHVEGLLHALLPCHQAHAWKRAAACLQNLGPSTELDNTEQAGKSGLDKTRQAGNSGLGHRSEKAAIT